MLLPLLGERVGVREVVNQFTRRRRVVELLAANPAAEDFSETKDD